MALPPPRQLSARRRCVQGTCRLPRIARCSNRAATLRTPAVTSRTYAATPCVQAATPCIPGCNPMHPRLQPYAPQALLSAARHLGGRRHLRALAAAAATCRLACGHRPTALLLLRHAWCRGHRRHRRGQCGGWGAAGAAGAGSYLHVQRRQAALRRECITCAQDAHIAGSRSCHIEGARKGSGWDGVCGG